ncbi:MAG TPA: acetylxylan esterase [Sedimentisphaerales bacterium]|nr:acetylxylan esterase [Sedimentisphaerales bacterium]
MMRRRVTRIGCGLLLLGSMALCASCAPSGMAKKYAGPKEMPPARKSYYSYPPRTVEPTVEVRKQKKSYDVLRIQFPSTLNLYGDEDIKVDYYRNTRPGRHPTVLMLPISGGVDFSVESFAYVFAPRGIHCALVHNRDVEIEQTQSADEVEAYFRQTVLDNRQVLDYLVTRPEVDPNRIGALGLSLGGIKASLVAAADPRIRCAVLGLAGGSMADIALHSTEPGLKDYVDEIQAMGISGESVYCELHEKILTDPLRLAPYTIRRSCTCLTRFSNRWAS